MLNVYTFRYPLFSLLCAFLFLCTGAKAQGNSPPPGLKIVQKSATGLEIEFDSPKEIQTLLVIISDSTGVSVFQDTQDNFTGRYKTSVTLPGKGFYSVEIIRDDQKYLHKIKLR